MQRAKIENEKKIEINFSLFYLLQKRIVIYLATWAKAMCKNKTN